VPTTIDSRFEALGLEGFEGAASDRIRDWLASELPPGADATQINDLWSSLFDSSAIPPGGHNDRLMQWYRSQGATGGSLPDLAYSYWTNRFEQETINDHDHL